MSNTDYISKCALCLKHVDNVIGINSRSKFETGYSKYLKALSAHLNIQLV